jgi:hypothetical protein
MINQILRILSSQFRFGLELTLLPGELLREFVSAFWREWAFSKLRALRHF